MDASYFDVLLHLKLNSEVKYNPKLIIFLLKQAPSHHSAQGRLLQRQLPGCPSTELTAPSYEPLVVFCACFYPSIYNLTCLLLQGCELLQGTDFPLFFLINTGVCRHNFF